MAEPNPSRVTRTDLYKRKVDLYRILGIEKTANANQITKAYRSLALRYHPDRNVGEKAEEAGEKFKEISTAYAILSDPNKRRQYDISGDSDAFGNGLESVDLENLNSMMRVFGAMMSKLGVPIPTQIGASTLIAAQELCREGGVREAERKRIPLLKLGAPLSGKTDRQEGVFYQLRLSAQDAENGIILTSCSSNRSRFKLVIFDSSGGVRYVQESNVTGDKKFTEATMYLVPFETITSFGTAMPQFSDEPAVFMKLSSLVAESRSLQEGTHLICVYGDNWLQSTKYTITALVAELHPTVVQNVKDVDEKIKAKKDELDTLQDEYAAAKEKFEQLAVQVEEETKKTDVLLQEREVAYNNFIEASLRRSVNLASTAQEASTASSPLSENGGGRLSSPSSSEGASQHQQRRSGSSGFFSSIGLGGLMSSSSSSGSGSGTGGSSNNPGST